MYAFHVTLRHLSHHTQQSYTFTQQEILMGRGLHCDLCIPYAWVSIQHIKIIWTKDLCKIWDLYSKYTAHIANHPLPCTQAYTTQKNQFTLYILDIELKCSIRPINAIPDTVYDQVEHLQSLWHADSGWIIVWIPSIQTHDEPPLHLTDDTGQVIQASHVNSTNDLYAFSYMIPYGISVNIIYNILNTKATNDTQYDIKPLTLGAYCPRQTNQLTFHSHPSNVRFVNPLDQSSIPIKIGYHYPWHEGVWTLCKDPSDLASLQQSSLQSSLKLIITRFHRRISKISPFKFGPKRK